MKEEQDDIRIRAATTFLVLSVGCLLSLGVVMLYSAGISKGGTKFFITQSVACAIGLVVCGVAAWCDYRWWRKLTWVGWLVAVGLLGLLLVPGWGEHRNGATRWLDFGLVQFQPSEVAKLALIGVLAHYGDSQQRYARTFWRGLVIPGLISAAVLGLIFVEPDRGTAILLAAVAGCMLLLSGVRWLYIVPPALVAMAGLAYSLWTDDVRSTRVKAWLHPEEHQLGTGMQAWQAMIAFGSGGWQGLGLGNGRQKTGWVPEQRTDFIFSIIGEELGLIASLGVVLMYVVLVMCGFYISARAPDRFGFLLGSGITFLIGLQALINMGVVTGALPNKGLPLPFVSYGGSSLVMMLAAVGLLVSIARAAGDMPAAAPNPFQKSRRRQKEAS